MNIYPSKFKDRRKKVMVEIKAVTKPWFWVDTWDIHQRPLLCTMWGGPGHHLSCQRLLAAVLAATRTPGQEAWLLLPTGASYAAPCFFSHPSPTESYSHKGSLLEPCSVVNHPFPHLSPAQAVLSWFLPKVTTTFWWLARKLASHSWTAVRPRGLGMRFASSFSITPHNQVHAYNLSLPFQHPPPRSCLRPHHVCPDYYKSLLMASLPSGWLRFILCTSSYSQSDLSRSTDHVAPLHSGLHFLGSLH